MSASKSSATYNKQRWEDSDFPILCETCLGEVPYIRMIKDRYGAECKICSRPFTTYRYCPGPKMRYKQTQICQTCSKLKNVCQTCILDLEYGLPVQVRDQALKISSDSMPKSDVNREYYIQNQERQMALTEGAGPVGLYGKAISAEAHDMLTKLARTRPYYDRNRPHICSFWVKGECKRGEECPYRHERPKDADDPLHDQNITDRYYGVDDPVASKLMNQYHNAPALETPMDKSITTLYLGNIDGVTEQQLRDHFYQFGEIKNIVIIPKQNRGFIQFTKRSHAEQAAEKSHNKLIINQKKINVRWGKQGGGGVGLGKDQDLSDGSGLAPHHSVPDTQTPAGLPAPPKMNPIPDQGGSASMSSNFFNLPPPKLPATMLQQVASAAGGAKRPAEDANIGHKLSKHAKSSIGNPYISVEYPSQQKPT